MFCSHKFNKVLDGHQYCEKCGKAVAAPCNHKWKRIDGYEVNRELYPGKKIKVAFVYVLECAVCGNLKRERIEAEGE